MISLVVKPVGRNRYTEVETEWRSCNKEAKTEPEVVVVGRRVEIVGIVVDEAGVVEDRKPDGADDVRRVLERQESVTLSTNGLSRRILRSDIAVLKATQGIGTAKREVLKSRFAFVVLAKGIQHARAANHREDLSLGVKHREEL